MALPLIIFLFLVITAVVLFALGALNYSVGAGFAFFTLAGVILVLTGLILWTSGLQLSTVASISDDLVYTYETLSYSDPALFILTSVFFWGGFVPIIYGLLAAFRQRSVNLDLDKDELFV